MSFLGGGWNSAEDFPFKFVSLPPLLGLGAGSIDEELVLEVNEPKRSDPSKLFRGTVANGSTMLGLAVPVFWDLVSDCTTGSGAAKKSNAGGFVEVTAGWDANRSTFVCSVNHDKIISRRDQNLGNTKEKV